MIVGIIESQKTQPPLKWVYIGTTGSQDGIYSVGPTSTTVTTTCRTSSSIISLMNTTRPPDDYSLGYVMRVNHQRTECSMFGCATIDCTPYYFETQVL